MQINIEGSESIEESFFFEAIPNKIMEDKETKEILSKWYITLNPGVSQIH